MFNFSQIQQFPDFLEFIPGNVGTIVSFSKLSLFLVEWKPPQVTLLKGNKT